jgi:hypothetical protein
MLEKKNFNIFYENTNLGYLELSEISNIMDLYKYLQSSKYFSNLSLDSIAYIITIKDISRFKNLWEQIKKEDSIKIEFNIGYLD